MTSVATFDSGAVLEDRTGAAIDVTSGAVFDVCGEALPNVEPDPEEDPSYLDPPTFDNVSAVVGRSVINLSCDTDRDSIVRFRAQAVVGDVASGPLYYSTWETIPISDGHVRQIAGLHYSTTYRVWIEIDALMDPDASWALFASGGVGPDFTTGGIETVDPDRPADGGD